MDGGLVWGIHAGRSGNAHNLFLKQNVTAIGWSEMGDLSKIIPTRVAFKKKVEKIYPTIKPRAISSFAGQTFRFVHEMKKGDFIVFPSTVDKNIYIGKVVSHVRYKPKIDSHYPNQRLVKWLKSVPRKNFSKGALYESGAAISFFLIKKYPTEFISAINNPEISFSSSNLL